VSESDTLDTAWLGGRWQLLGWLATIFRLALRHDGTRFIVRPSWSLINKLLNGIQSWRGFRGITSNIELRERC